ncbi:MAG: TIGR02281 family clan AA aspartic protease [Leptolyngbya sp. BL-A-14]
MLKRSCSGTALVILSGAILLGSTACSHKTVLKTAVSSTEQTPPVVPVPSSSAVTTTPPSQATSTKRDTYKLALEKADSASNITVSAQSQDDWKLVVSRWQQAIQFMRAVPSSSPYGALAKAKLTEYQRNLAYAQKQAARADSSETASEPALLPIAPRTYTASNISPATTNSDETSGSKRVYVARIKRRAGGTPVIDVTFNGNRTFEMIVDTGASGTVITSSMASSLGVKVIGKAKVDTASDKSVEVPLAYVNSIAVGGAVIKGVVVAIGNSALDTGLLGHDFFDDYDVTIKRDVVEFRQR